MARTLVVVPSVPAIPDGDAVFMDRKAVEGLSLYASLWPGPVRCLMRAGARSDIAFGTHYRTADLPFEIVIVPDDIQRSIAAFADAALILAAGDSHHDLGLAGSVRTPLVYIIEYTLETRLRINRLLNGLSLRGLKTALWTLATERQRRRTFRASAGLQCNGTPAYDAYRRLVPSALLYFDTRTTDDRQIAPAALAAKHAAMQAGKPLRIAFSGRLERMKGADHLLLVAEALARRNVPFLLDIYGDGQLRGPIAAQIAATGLADRVTLHGPVSFEDELIPTMIDRIDLFLCCHRQADPSCTYMETLSCGVPIVGYANAAFTGICAKGDIGIAVPMDDARAAAVAIEALARDRVRLAGMSAAAAALGRAHSFEREFAKRITHLKSLAGLE